ncbi:MAG: hypothetical protein LUC06_01115, partial [Oscillospiraceae bacterium]|nr:hypothetical protein [Oscillospiraceae bacterium]
MQSLNRGSSCGARLCGGFEPEKTAKKLQKRRKIRLEVISRRLKFSKKVTKTTKKHPKSKDFRCKKLELLGG